MISKAEKKEIWAKYIIGVLSLFVLAIFNVPFLPGHFNLSRDSSWIYVLHEAFLGNWTFGQDIIWHYGPLGFLFAKVYHPETYSYLLLFWGFLSLTFGLVTYSFIVNTSRKPNLVAIIAIVVIASFTVEAMLLVLPIVFYFYRFFVPCEKRSKILIFLLFGSLVIIALIKITYLLLGILFLLLADILRIFSERKVPFYLPAGIVSYILVWALLGQPVENIPSFLFGAFELSRGFSASMLPDKSILITAACFLTGIGIILFQTAIVWLKKYGSKSWGPIIGFSIFCLILNKAAFSNPNDHHQLESFAAFLIVVLLIRDVFFEDLPKWSRSILAIYAVLVLSAYSLTFYTQLDKQSELDQVLELSKKYTTGDSSLLGKFFKDVGNNRERYKAAMENIRKQADFSSVHGSVDLYPSMQMLIFANGLDYRPRPVFQSYHVYTPYLAKKNRDFLLSESAPDNILFNVRTFRGRFPSLDDGLSYPEILSRYTSHGMIGSYIHFKKREKKKAYKFDLIKKQEYNIDDLIVVPGVKNNSAIWAEIDVEETWFGKLARLLFRSMPVPVKIKKANGVTQKYWLIPEVAKEGFLLSPVIYESQSLSVLNTPFMSTLTGSEVKTLQVDIESDQIIRFLYKDNIKVKFSYLLIS